MALWLVIRGAHFPAWGGSLEVTPQGTGYRLLSDYVLAFELISILLVIAMMGAVMVARRDPGKRRPPAHSASKAAP